MISMTYKNGLLLTSFSMFPLASLYHATLKDLLERKCQVVNLSAEFHLKCFQSIKKLSQHSIDFNCVKKTQ